MQRPATPFLAALAGVAFAAAALAPPAAADPATFPAFVERFKAEAAAEGIDRATLDRAFAGVRYNAKVVELDAYQPEFTKPVGDYIAERAGPEAVSRGRALRGQHAALFARVQARYGVEPEYILAIWRIETGYGSFMGNFAVVEALATLLHGAAKRQELWRRELIAALRLIQRGEVAIERMKGSWAGAMGHTQFLPSSWLEKAVDFDGDGKRDLFASLPDVFASTANYLVLAGWRPGMPFAIEVTLPANFAYEQAEVERLPVGDWARQGVVRAGGGALPDWAGPTAIYVPAGHRGPAFLASANFRALLDYNNSVAYALSVGLLAERMKGAGTVLAPWPPERPLSRAEKEEIQRRLASLGYEVGRIDGAIGPATRAAIRLFQKKIGVPADAFADAALLERLRAAQP
jgi:membrane-bound lytic murein transglycosylase B